MTGLSEQSLPVTERMPRGENDAHPWHPLPNGNLLCPKCLRIEDRDGQPSRGSTTTYRGGIGYTARLSHFPGACRPRFDRVMKEISDA